MSKSIRDEVVFQTIYDAHRAAATGEHRRVKLGGEDQQVAPPFPSPADWRDQWIYFLMIDRFNNPDSPPKHAWNQRCPTHQGGTYKGVTEQLDYLADLGVGAIWITPVVKNSKPDWDYNYHGYGAQSLLHVDERFASDGTRQTAEKELRELVDSAHQRGIFVILDIVLNHTGRVFDYVINGETKTMVKDRAILEGPLGSEPPIQWLNGFGAPRADWQNHLPPSESLSEDDAVWPIELQHEELFRRRGTKVTDKVGDHLGFVPGDFASLRQLVVEYDASVPGQEQLRAIHGRWPVLNVLLSSFQYLVALYDFDGFRIDTVKYVSPRMVEIFGNAMREFALSIGKRNFFTFGEVYDDEPTIAAFVGRNGTEGEGFGIDAALDFPLFHCLGQVAKGMAGVETIREIFSKRREVEQELLSSHGEAGRFFVSFLDNHDQSERIAHPDTPRRQVELALALMFTLQGIPCVYYGTEQGLTGTKKTDGSHDPAQFEGVREALWGRTQPDAFDMTQPSFVELRKLSRLRARHPALRYGRLYFRHVSGNGRDFGLSTGRGGVLAYSRVLSSWETLVVANTNSARSFKGFVLVDLDMNRRPQTLSVLYSNLGTNGSGEVRLIPDAVFHKPGLAPSPPFPTAAMYIELGPNEVQVLG